MAIKTTASEAGREDVPASSLPARLSVRWLYPILVALPLIVLNGGWIAFSEMRAGITEVTISTLFMGVTFMLFVITLVNLAVRRLFGPRAAMNQPEMMAVYTMLSMASVVAGVGNFGFFLPFLVNVFHYADKTNGWSAFWYLLPNYIGPRDPEILRRFYEGHSSVTPADLAAWAYPLTVWGIFFFVLLWTTLCLAAIVRRRWADEEHLPFPVIAVPLEITREGAPLYRNPLMWAGFAVPGGLHTLNTLASMYPGIPTFKPNTLHDLVFDAPLQYPWNGVDSFFYLLHGSGLGFGYLINTDVSFSLWFFYLVKKMLDVLAVSQNWRDPLHGWFGDSIAQFPYTGYQGYGAWLVLGLTTLWAGRSSYRAYFRRAFRGDPSGTDAHEPLSARAATIGFLVGFLALSAFFWSTGGSLWLPPAFLAIFVLISVALARIRAETAVPSTELIWINPQNILTAVTGTSNLPRIDLVHMGLGTWFNSDYRAVALPHQLEGFVGMERARGKMRSFVWVILLACVVAIVSALLWDLQMYYINGAGTAKVNRWRIDRGGDAWRNIEKWLHNPKPPDGPSIAGMGFGAAMTFALAALRAKFMGFPLHPAAYVLNTSFANDFFWCDMLVAWAIKTMVLRYGGMQFYRQLLPLFLGLILGDFVVGSLWSIIGTLLGLDLYRTFAI